MMTPIGYGNVFANILRLTESRSSSLIMLGYKVYQLNKPYAIIKVAFSISSGML